jgi:pimeloyl-ACP methyl ester carboxylesterase
MPIAKARDIHTYHEVIGQGAPLVLVHGGFVDLRMWDPQVDHFSRTHRVIRYDLRGHGRTGPSERSAYSIHLFADDLVALLDHLGVDRATVCGVSLGGMIAQAFAVAYPDRLSALVLAGTAAASALTLGERLQRDLLFPRWALVSLIRLLGARRFVDFSFWLARVTRGERWFGHDEAVRDYVRQAMLRVPTAEYIKIYGAIYGFRLLDLSAIHAPTLILNGEHESASVFHHTRVLSRLISNAKSQVIPEAGHVLNMENPAAFNAAVSAFLTQPA